MTTATPAPHYGEKLAGACEAFLAFTTSPGIEGPTALLCDGDADGLSAGVVLWHYFQRAGAASPESISVLHPGKGENAFTHGTLAQLAATRPARLFVLDLGVSSRPLLPGVPTLFVDHHRPTGQPEGATVISGYGWDPVPTSSLLTYLLCSSAGKDDMGDKAWVAAMGNMADLGPPYPDLEAAAREQRLKWVREAGALLNAAKRSRLYAIGAAFRVLRDADGAREIVEGDSDDLRVLRECRREVKEELDQAKRLAPRFSSTEKVALLEFSSPSRIHPLLAQSWHGRLKGFIVIAANHGFLPGKVSFSARTSSGANLIEFLGRFRAEVGDDEPEYGHGHDQAAGGVISEDAWGRLKAAMGLPVLPA